MDIADGPGPQLGARLGYLLKHAFFRLEDLHGVHMAGGPVNVRELSVLLLLDGREPESQQQAANRLGVDRTTMVGLLDGLEGKGLLARLPDPADRRRNVVALTDAGRTALREARAESDRAERELLADLSPAEARQLRDMLIRILSSTASTRDTASPDSVDARTSTATTRSPAGESAPARLRPGASAPNR